jgi:hypothetical protein
VSVAYTLYVNEPPSRNLEERVSPEVVEEARLRELHRIDYLMHSLLEDLTDLLPAGYSVSMSKEDSE